MEVLRRILHGVSRGCNLILRLTLGGLLVSMGYVLGRQVCTRGVLGSSECWTEELARDFLIWLAFLGGALAARRNAHLSMGLSVLLNCGLAPPAPHKSNELDHHQKN